MKLLNLYHPVRTSYKGEDHWNSFDQLARNFLPDFGVNYHPELTPSTNIVENDGEFKIEMALPGVNKKHIKIDHENGFLTVKVEGNTDKENTPSYNLYEFDYSNASRTFRVSEKIDTGNISAKYEDGILSIVLPKREEFVKKPAMAIEVK